MYISYSTVNGTDGNSRINVIMHQSIPAVPIPPGNRGAFAHVVNPGGGALANFLAARGPGISRPRGYPGKNEWNFCTNFTPLTDKIEAGADLV